MDVVGVALMFSVQGHSHRTMAAQLGLPAETVRGWIRRVNRRAEWLRIEGTTAAAAFDPTLTAIEPTASRSPLAEASRLWAWPPLRPNGCSVRRQRRGSSLRSWLEASSLAHTAVAETQSCRAQPCSLPSDSMTMADSVTAYTSACRLPGAWDR